MVIYGLVCMCIGAAIYGINDACRTTMEKKYENNKTELSKLKYPFYPMYAYWKYKKDNISQA